MQEKMTMYTFLVVNMILDDSVLSEKNVAVYVASMTDGSRSDS